MLGEEYCSHNIEIGVRRLREYGLEPVFMPNALKGVEYLKDHPEAEGSGFDVNFGHATPRCALQYGPWQEWIWRRKFTFFIKAIDI